MKKILNYNFYNKQNALAVGTYFTNSLYLPYDKFLFMMRGEFAAGKTIDVTLQIYHPEQFHADWLDYFHFTQFDSANLGPQFKEYNQILGKFRFKIVLAGAAFEFGEWFSVAGYLGEI